MRWIVVLAVVVAALAVLVSARLASACDGAEGRCAVDGGYYLAAPPPGWDGATDLPLIVYFHGWNSSPEATFRNQAMIAAAHARGALFVAPWARNGYWRQIGRGRAEGGRDELAYIRAVMADVRRRWPIDTTRTLTSGFSRGASMSWNVACYAGDLFAAHAPIAGGFWGSTPPTCPTGPVTLRHIRGLADRVVAYDDIGIYNSMPITEGFAMLRGVNGADPDSGHRYALEHPRRPRTCTRWDGTTGHVLEVCLHPRGHSIPAEWVAEGLDWLEGLRAGR